MTTNKILLHVNNTNYNQWIAWQQTVSQQKKKSLKTENSEQFPSYKIHDKAEWRLQVVSYQK